MATVAKKICDKCRSDQDVTEVVIIKSWRKSTPYGVDLCGACYREIFTGLEKKSHPVKHSNVRPPVRMKETILTPAQLGEDIPEAP